jgi:hypothetical protein
VISKDVDGGPPAAMTITTNRKVNDFGAWYQTCTFNPRRVGDFSNAISPVRSGTTASTPAA